MPASKTLLAQIHRPTPRIIARLARKLAAGDVVAVPTETVYGLAANAFDADACAKIFRAKGRPRHDPLIVHLYSWRELSQVCQPSDAALKLARHFWPGPLTLVLPKQTRVPAIVTAGRPTVAVRVPSHPVFRQLLKQAGLPLAAPSANPFGYVSPTTAAHVRESLGRKIRHILDGGPSQIGVESTIVDLRHPEKPVLLRPGAITAEQIAAVLGRAVASRKQRGGDSKKSGRGELAPGLLARHYSPRTPVELHAVLPAKRSAQEAYVHLRRPVRAAAAANVFWFHVRAGLPGVASNLFATLRELDTRGFRKLHVQLAPEEGLGVAINDRLRRAAAKRVTQRA